MAITRIKANNSEQKVKKAIKLIPKKPKVKKIKIIKPKKGIFKLIAGIGKYFKGAWTELRLVRWPDRKSAWAMTAAVLLFTGFFVILIILLDFGFSQIFKIILK